MRRTRQPKGPTSFSRSHPRVDLIFNEISGQGDPTSDLKLITSTLSAAFSVIHVWKTTAHHDGFHLAREALASGGTLLVACGGDGTVAAVAAAIKQHVGGHAVLGVIPRGTANALSAALHIPMRVSTAAQMIAAGTLRRLDFPTVMPSLPSPSTPSVEHTDSRGAANEENAHDNNGYYDAVAASGIDVVPAATGTPKETLSIPKSMLLLCGIGLEANTVRRAHRQLKRTIGSAAYAVAGWETIWQQPKFTCDITMYDVDDALMYARGHVRSEKLVLTGLRLQGVTVANAAPPTSVLAQGIGDVHPDDGLLEVVCINSDHPLSMMGTMLSMLRSSLLRRRETRGNVFGMRARKVEIACWPPQRIVIDGEDAGQTPITIGLCAGDVHSIEVIAPKAGTVNRQNRRISRSLTRLWRNVRGFAMFSLAISLLSRSRRSNRLSNG